MMPRYYINVLGGAARVARLVALAPSNYGTTLDGLTALGRQLGLVVPINSALSTVCTACVEQEEGSAFLNALNVSPTVAGVNYTVIESRDDEVVTPYTNAFLPAAPNVTNITVNRQCLLDSSDHLEIAADPVAMADMLNALDPAQPVRVPCLVVLPVTGPVGPVPLLSRPVRTTWLPLAVRTNDEVAALLAEYADLLVITGGDAFRIRSYEKAARSVGGYPQDLARVDPAELDKIPNVGRAIAAKIRDYLGTGHIRQLEAMRARVPDGVRRLTGVAGLGPKRAMVLYTERGIDSIDELEAAIAAGRLEGLPGFGPKSGENLLRGIELIRRSAGRIRSTPRWTWPRSSSPGCPACPAVPGARTRARCAGCGTRSATWTSSRQPRTRPR